MGKGEAGKWGEGRGGGGSRQAWDGSDGFSSGPQDLVKDELVMVVLVGDPSPATVPSLMGHDPTYPVNCPPCAEPVLVAGLVRTELFLL